MRCIVKVSGNAAHWIVAAAIAALPGACSFSPMYVAQSDAGTPSSGMALIWFVRQVNTHRDLSGMIDVAIADQQGHFVGAIGTKQRFAVEVPRGVYTFYGFRAFGGKIKAFHSEAGLPQAVIVEAEPGKVYFVELDLMGGANGLATMFPIGPRFGKNRAYVEQMLVSTKRYSVNHELAQQFFQKHGTEYWWDHGWRAAAEMVRTWDGVAREEHTLHSSDAFRLE